MRCVFISSSRGLALVALLVAALTVQQPAHAANASDGNNQEQLHWVETDDPEGRFLIPANWQVRASKGKLLGSLVFSRESDAGIFDRLQTLMSVNLISNLSKMQSGIISTQIPSYVQSIEQDQTKQVEAVTPLSRGQFHGSCVRFSELRDNTPMRIQRCYLANDSADLLLVVDFQARRTAWKQAWRSGREMMQSFELKQSHR